MSNSFMRSPPRFIPERNPPPLIFHDCFLNASIVMKGRSKTYPLSSDRLTDEPCTIQQDGKDRIRGSL